MLGGELRSGTFETKESQSFFVLQCMSDRPVANVKMIPLKFYGWLRKHDQQLQIRDNL